MSFCLVEAVSTLDAKCEPKVSFTVSRSFFLIIDHLNLCFRNCSKYFSLYVTTQNVTTSFNLLIQYKSLFQFSRLAKVCLMSLELIYPFMKYHLLVRQMYI